MTFECFFKEVHGFSPAGSLRDEWRNADDDEKKVIWAYHAKQKS
tara:strand:- start:57 stop:188 length:132 start_codon:yes stop_codon:yes gene_type:complete